MGKYTCSHPLAHDLKLASPLNADGELVLKRAHFIVPDIRVVYPISSDTAPSSTTQSEARLEIDAAERLRRETEQQQAWTAARVEALYRDICKIRDERVDPTIAAQIRAGIAAPKVLDLSRMRMTFDVASALADLLALDWGLQRLILSDCDLDDLVDPKAHSPCNPYSRFLAHLALANNKRLRFSAFKMISTFLGKAHALEFIDLSMNVMDKRAVEAILAVLPPAPPAPPPPAATPRMSRTPSIASIDSAASAIQFSNPFDGSAAVRPTIDTSVPRRVRDPTRYPESPGAGPSSPRLSVSTSPRGSVSSPRGSVSGVIPPLESPTSGGTTTPRPGSPVSADKNKKTRRAWMGIKFDECALKGPGLEAFGETSKFIANSFSHRVPHAIRTSQIQTVSLRGNKIGSAGAVAIALMIKDYPDQGTGPGGTGALALPGAVGRASVGEQTLGLGFGLGSQSQTPLSSAPPSPRPPRSLSTPAATGPTGHNQDSLNHTESANNRPNVTSQSSLTTISTFKERDITSSPPTGSEGLANGSDRQEKLATSSTKPPPPVIAPKPVGLQARLAGAVAAGVPSLHQPYLQPSLTPQPTILHKLLPCQPNPSPHHLVIQLRAAAGVSNNVSSQPSSGTGTPSDQQGSGSPAKSMTGLPGITPGGPTVQTSTGTGSGMIPVPYTPRQTPLAVRLQNAARAAASQPSSQAPRGGAPPLTRPNIPPRPAVPSPVTMITSSSLGGVTTRLPSNPPANVSTALSAGPAPGTTGSRTSAALMDIVRSMEGVPKLGCLTLLDLRSNDVRGGVSYIAQVLKRLVQLAEALKYNSTLASLDLSNNPCSSPSLEGIHVMRNALTLNTTLRHLSLSSTGLTSQGAIALAEFIPDFPSLQHLDLTSNSLDVAGVLALSVGLKVNYELRCLDLSISPGEEEMARLCREILKICLRNTERAQATEEARAGKLVEGIMSPVLEDTASAVWEPIEHSTLARDAQVNINATAAAGVDPAGRIGNGGRIVETSEGGAIRACRDDPNGEGRSLPGPTVGLGLDIHGEVSAEQTKEEELGNIEDVGGEGDGDGDGETSPAENLSRSWVAEEGEILRKSRVLLSPNELESESGADSEALRQELLEAQVERAPARVVEEVEELPMRPEPEPEPEPESEETTEGPMV
ncbi:Leucine Rich repeat [Rhizoctonia solani]|uniref:Leucine Rich repeat n=1 Tax=Rhizoctonia solani TaxID=456999 RepID=A0A8H7M6N3_9AGAM|nr:Leucine Rich repeat [Rhizoctonia solani]